MNDVSTTSPTLSAAQPSMAPASSLPPPLPSAVEVDPALRERITQAAVKFESFFVAQIFKQTREATAVLADEDSPLNDRVNDSAFALAEQTVADAVAGQRAFGIADVLIRQMLPAPAAPVAPANTAPARKLS